MGKIKELLQETMDRLELLGFDPDGEVCMSMMPEATVKCSDGTILFQFPDGKVCHPVYDISDEQRKRIEEIQKEYKIFVYHVIRTDCGELGLMDAYLYISLPVTDEECNRDRLDIKCKCPFAYVYNITDPELSEFGSIGVEFKYGAIVRTA